MALNGKTISTGVLDILNIDGGVDASTARNVKDGDGTVTPLWLTTTKVGIGTTSPEAYLHVTEDTDLGTSVGDKQMFLKLSGDSANNDYLETSLIRVSTYDGDGGGADNFDSAQWRIQRKVDATYMGWIGFGGEEGSDRNNYGISFGIGSDGASNNPLAVDEAMRIEGSNGYVGIGTTSPADKLHVADGLATNYVAKFEHTEAGGSADPRGIRVNFASDLDNSDDYFFLCQGASTTKMTVRGDGDVWTVDDVILSSDRDMKENIVDASPKLDDLLKLKVRNFNWKSQYKPDSSKKIGFIAQEVEEVFPALVREHLSPIESEANAGVMRKEIKQSFVPILVKAIQELTAKVTALENA